MSNYICEINNKNEKNHDDEDNNNKGNQLSDGQLISRFNSLFTTICGGILLFGRRNSYQREKFRLLLEREYPKIFGQQAYKHKYDEYDKKSENNINDSQQERQHSFESLFEISHWKIDKNSNFVTSTSKKSSPKSRLPFTSENFQPTSIDKKINDNNIIIENRSETSNKIQNTESDFKTPQKTNNLINIAQKTSTVFDSPMNSSKDTLFLPNLQNILESGTKKVKTEINSSNIQNADKISSPITSEINLDIPIQQQQNKFEDAAKRKKRLLKEKIEANKASTEMRLKAAKLKREKIELERAKRAEMLKNNNDPRNKSRNFIGKTIDKIFGNKYVPTKTCEIVDDDIEIEKQRLKNLKTIREALATPLDDYGHPVVKLSYPKWCDEKIDLRNCMSSFEIQKMMKMPSTEALRLKLESLDPNKERIIRSDDTMLE